MGSLYSETNGVKLTLKALTILRTRLNSILSFLFLLEFNSIQRNVNKQKYRFPIFLAKIILKTFTWHFVFEFAINCVGIQND